MRTVIVSASRSPHGNTQAIADAFGEELDAVVIAPEELTSEVIEGADRIGFGSGIYLMDFDARLRDCIAELPDMARREVFIFATSGLAEPPFRRYTRGLQRKLEERGCRVVGTFTCRGLDTWAGLGLFGGINKGRPNADDVERAREFARQL